MSKAFEEYKKRKELINDVSEIASSSVALSVDDANKEYSKATRFEELKAGSLDNQVLLVRDTIKSFENELPAFDSAEYQVAKNIACDVFYRYMDFYPDVDMPIDQITYNGNNPRFYSAKELLCYMDDALRADDHNKVLNILFAIYCALCFHKLK